MQNSIKLAVFQVQKQHLDSQKGRFGADTRVQHNTYVSVKEALGKSPYGIVLVNTHTHTHQLQLSVAVKLVIRSGVPAGAGLV